MLANALQFEERKNGFFIVGITLSQEGYEEVKNEVIRQKPYAALFAAPVDFGPLAEKGIDSMQIELVGEQNIYNNIIGMIDQFPEAVDAAGSGALILEGDKKMFVSTAIWGVDAGIRSMFEAVLDCWN